MSTVCPPAAKELEEIHLTGGNRERVLCQLEGIVSPRGNLDKISLNIFEQVWPKKNHMFERHENRTWSASGAFYSKVSPKNQQFLAPDVDFRRLSEQMFQRFWDDGCWSRAAKSWAKISSEAQISAPSTPPVSRQGWKQQLQESPLCRIFFDMNKEAKNKTKATPKAGWSDNPRKMSQNL